jgi:hypothetical protein
MQRFARAPHDRDRTRPAADKENKLMHGFALYAHTIRNRLLCGSGKTQRKNQRSR